MSERYRTIVADPPWPYRVEAGRNKLPMPWRKVGTVDDGVALTAAVIAAADDAVGGVAPRETAETLAEAAEWAYMHALRIAEPAYTEDGITLAAEAIGKRLGDALDAYHRDTP